MTKFQNFFSQLYQLFLDLRDIIIIIIIIII